MKEHKDILSDVVSDVLSYSPVRGEYYAEVAEAILQIYEHPMDGYKLCKLIEPAVSDEVVFNTKLVSIMDDIQKLFSEKLETKVEGEHLFMRDAVIELPLTGCATLDLSNVVKNFNDECFVSRWDNGKEVSFRLVAVRNNKMTLKTTISTEDALFLIEELNLVAQRNSMFRMGTTYRMVK
ncbi:hypothetical protein [Vibrio crassostreae]|uniref:hypothetical protein n=1 Tax=Vibrio crassostreae TaxID=246167 RepID=UPI001B30C363|nr:hypothetical protein [Vibrio crassostreae]